MRITLEDGKVTKGSTGAGMAMARFAVSRNPIKYNLIIPISRREARGEERRREESGIDDATPCARRKT